MAEQGENAFRDAETNALQKVVDVADTVIALGGGALLREENRSLAETSGQVVFLDAGLPALVARLSKDENKRPLLTGELESKLAAQLENRASTLRFISPAGGRIPTARTSCLGYSAPGWTLSRAWHGAGL